MATTNQLANSQAGSTISLRRFYRTAIGVFWSVFVALWAMGYSPTYFEGSFPASLSVNISALNIDLSGHGFEVRWIDARPDAAQVIEIKSGGYRANKRLITEPMGQSRDLMVSARNRHGESPVSTLIQPAGPEPAASVRLGRNMQHDSFFHRYSRASNHSGNYSSYWTQVQGVSA